MTIDVRDKEAIVTNIRAHLPRVKIILFGSRARGDNKGGADYDIALDDGSRIDRILLNTIIQAIEATTIPVNVDVVDIHSASRELAKEIKRDGIEW